MTYVPTVIIGAGQSGLAMSHALTERSVEHLILERGTVANAWRTERWDSLRLLTPNWLNTLPGQMPDGSDPDGFMSTGALVGRLQDYATAIDAPVQGDTEVRRVQHVCSSYLIETNRGTLRCTTLVLATGACNVAVVPGAAAALPESVRSLTARDYKRPADLPDGGVLVVGGSATGIQLAREIHASGRPVTLSVGEHIRAPRNYRGRDIKWWMDALGLLDERFDAVDDLSRVRRAPSLQLVGTPGHETLDLKALTDAGIDIVGRFAGVRDGRALFSGSLANHCALSDQKMTRLLNAIDAWIVERGIEAVVGPAWRPEPTRVPQDPLLELNLTCGAVRSVLWATGYRPDYSWLDVPVLDRKGRLRHDGGIVDAPGLYAMGLPFMRRRKSTLIAGAGPDAADLADHMMSDLSRTAA